jgi:hypothetical protein
MTLPLELEEKLREAEVQIAQVTVERDGALD